MKPRITLRRAPSGRWMALCEGRGKIASSAHGVKDPVRACEKAWSSWCYRFGIDFWQRHYLDRKRRSRAIR